MHQQSCIGRLKAGLEHLRQVGGKRLESETLNQTRLLNIVLLEGVQGEERARSDIAFGVVVVQKRFGE
jgi:hypothetical protein